MSTDTNDRLNDGGHDDSIELEKRTRRALSEPLTVLDHDETPVDDVDATIVTVTSHSGETYEVDVVSGACSCADYRHRDPEGGCKHVRRARVALSRETLDARTLRAVDVDPQLGAFTPGPRVATSDGGVVGGDVDGDTDSLTVREAVEGAEVLDEDSDENDTSARESEALDEEVAAVAPYANNRFHNDR